MTCPRCHTTDLDEKDRKGVKIDICPSCRGVWLDRGELEKLIAQAMADRRDRDNDDDDDDDDARTRRFVRDPEERRRYHSDDDDGPGRRRSWWDIFD